MPQSEKSIVKHIRRYVERIGGKTIPLQHTALLETGTPDLLGCWDGIMFLVEVKAGKGTTRKIQDVRIAQWKEAGARVFIVRSLNDFIYALAAVRGGNVDKNIEALCKIIDDMET